MATASGGSGCVPGWSRCRRVVAYLRLIRRWPTGRDTPDRTAAPVARDRPVVATRAGQEGQQAQAEPVHLRIDQRVGRNGAVEGHDGVMAEDASRGATGEPRCRALSRTDQRLGEWSDEVRRGSRAVTVRSEPTARVPRREGRSGTSGTSPERPTRANVCRASALPEITARPCGRLTDVTLDVRCGRTGPSRRGRVRRDGVTSADQPAPP